MSEIKIIEKQQIPSGGLMIFGFPDVGLVGVIAASHLIEELNLVEVAYVDSKLLPPVIVLHEGIPHSPMRIFGNEKILLAASEIPISADIIYQVMDSLIDWAKGKKAKMLVSLSGMPIEDRQDLKDLKVFAAASAPEVLKTVQSKGIEVLMEGYLVGPQAIMLMRCSQMGVPGVTLLAQCFLNYPDPEAAAEILKSFGDLSGIKVDTAKLLEKGEEIRLKARDVMKRTQQEMTKTKKGQEFDIPVYVS